MDHSDLSVVADLIRKTEKGEILWEELGGSWCTTSNETHIRMFEGSKMVRGPLLVALEFLDWKTKAVIVEPELAFKETPFARILNWFLGFFYPIDTRLSPEEAENARLRAKLRELYVLVRRKSDPSELPEANRFERQKLFHKAGHRTGGSL